MIDDCTALAARTWRWIPRVWQAWYISGGPGTPQEQIKQLRSLQLFYVTSVCRASDWRENKPWLWVSPQSPDYAKRAFKSSLNEGTDATHNGWAGRGRPSKKDGGISQPAVALEMFQFKFNIKWQSFSNSNQSHFQTTASSTVGCLYFKQRWAWRLQGGGGGFLIVFQFPDLLPTS